MSELTNQINAKKERLQRFAEAAVRFENKGRADADLKTATMLERCLAKPAPVVHVRREYETAGRQPIYVPITWRILRAVADEFDMPVSEFIGQKREPKFTLARYVAIGLMLQLTNMSLPAVGRRLGGRDHTTILNGRNRLNELLKSEAFRNRFEQIKVAVSV